MKKPLENRIADRVMRILKRGDGITCDWEQATDTDRRVTRKQVIEAIRKEVTHG